MTQATQSVAIDPSLETIPVGPLTIRFLITGNDSNGSASVFECTVPRGEKLRSAPHSHDAFEETVYGLEGVLTWTVDGQPFDIGPGQSICIPRGAVHRFDNFGDHDAKVLMVATPAKFGPEFFREVSAMFEAAGGGPPDPGQAAEIMRRYGLTPVMPAS
ncbi:MAG: cupin domain-containing protein [Thermomicrobiales bacterium]